MASKEIVSGVGVRYGVAFDLDDSTGLPLPPSASATPYTGVEIEGIKTLSFNDSAPQRTTHYGNDNAYAQDTLPATEAGSATMTTSKTNLTLDAFLEGVKVRTINNTKYRVTNSDQRGNEPQVMLQFYRQALDTVKGSATFGKLRQWHEFVYPSARVSGQTQAMEQTNTDKTYEITPTPVQYTPWNEQLNLTNWGTQRGEGLEGTANYQPRWNFWRGNGTLTAFQLSVAPADSDHIDVWVDGTLTVPSAVNTSTASPAFTLGAAAANNKLVAARIQTPYNY